MGIDVKQLRDIIIVPMLFDLFDGEINHSAVNIMLGTCAQESAMGKYIKQIGGPALGIFQMEPATYRDIINNYLFHRPSLEHKIMKYASMDIFPDAQHLAYNLLLASIMCRLHYLRVAEQFPDKDDVEGLAKYWKKYYNTPGGKGTEEEFIENYHRYAL